MCLLIQLGKLHQAGIVIPPLHGSGIEKNPNQRGWNHLHIQMGDIFGVLFDIATTRLYLIPHKEIKLPVCTFEILDMNL
jgi:hypothetical protein